MCVCVCDEFAHRVTDGHISNEGKNKYNDNVCNIWPLVTRVCCEFFIILVRVVCSLLFSVFFGYYTWSWLVWWSSHGNLLQIFQLLPKNVERIRLLYSILVRRISLATLVSSAKHHDHFLYTKIDSLDYVNDHNAVDVNCFCWFFFRRKMKKEMGEND